MEDDSSCCSLHLKVEGSADFGNEEWPIKANVRSKAPNFMGTAVFKGAFHHLDIADYLGKYLVILFYPLDFATGSQKEIVSFSVRHNEFAKINTSVVACSVDSEYAHLAWCNTPKKNGGVSTLFIPLLSDLNRRISTDYGVLLNDLGHSLRAVIVIDKLGIVRQKTINDLFVPNSVDEVLRVVQLIQFTDASKAPYGPSNTKSKCIRTVR